MTLIFQITHELTSSDDHKQLAENISNNIHQCEARKIEMGMLETPSAATLKLPSNQAFIVKNIR